MRTEPAGAAFRGYWHVRPLRHDVLTLPSRDHSVRAIVRRHRSTPDWFQVYLAVPAEAPSDPAADSLPPLRRPPQWELRPLEPQIADTFQGARELARQQLALYEEGSTSLFRRRTVAARPSCVSRLQHTSGCVAAAIFHSADRRYETRCFVWEPVGATLDHSYVEWDWPRWRMEPLVFSYSLASAERAAADMMEEA